MILDNFEKTREKIDLELKQRLNRKNINNQIYKKKNEIFDKDIYINECILEMDLYKCIFQNTKFINYNFKNVTFFNCIFKNIEFDSCKFNDGKDSIIIFENNCQFINCTFRNCDLKKVIFKNVSMKNSDFILSDMRDVIINMSYLESIYFKDCDCRSFKVINSVIGNIEFKDEFITKFNENTFIDKIDINKVDSSFYERTSIVYKNIEAIYEANRLFDNAGEYYYLSKCMEQKKLKGIDKLKLYIFWILCGYGERPTYALITSIEILLIFAIIYMFLGLDIGGNIINYNIDFIIKLPIDNLALDFFHSLYFSIVTFTAVGYGDITPIGYSIILSSIEMVLGVTMIGVWTAVLARKITR